ncbi:interleukin-6 receptor subunit alpha [Symphorus nematophorus]
MRIFLPLLCVLCASPVHSISEGTCPRKDPPPGVLVLSPGSKLVLDCSGQVMVNGVKVRNISNTSGKGRSSSVTPATVNIISTAGVSMKSDKQTLEDSVSEGYHFNPTVTEENRRLRQTDTGYTASPTTYPIQPTRLPMAEETDDYEEEEGEGEEEGSRVTRGIKLRPQWKWNGTTVGKGDRDWGEITFERRGTKLSLSSVRLTDSGTYKCYNRGRERFSLKVTVAGPPEKPTLFCYKKSPSSKIRCEWKPQKPVTIRPDCYLLLSKSPTGSFSRFQCSYSLRASRCWCALKHNEDEMRTVHMAYLCVTSIAGNASSILLEFTPLAILKPDPPSDVSVHQEEGQETRLMVTWRNPLTWNPEGKYYELMYEMKYRPIGSSIYHEQIQEVRGRRKHCITDAMPGVEYLIQLRAKDEYDGVWSDWSTPVFASSWTAPTPTDDPATTMPPDYESSEGSGSDDSVHDDTIITRVPDADPVSPHVLWISGSFALLSVILAVYIFRHKDRFMSKLRGLSVVTQCGDTPHPPPSTPTAPEGQALVTFGPPRYKQSPPSEVEEEREEINEEDEQCANERIEAMHFNNTSYFFLQQ